MLLDTREVSQSKFGGDGLQVFNGVDAAVDVDHILIVKTPHDIHNGIGLTNIGKELIAQPFALARPSHEPCDIDKLHRGGHDPLGRNDGGELREAWVGQLDNACVGLDGAKGVILSRDPSLGKGVKEGALAYIGQANDSTLQCHG